MAHIEEVLAAALAQKGDRYVFGAEVPPGTDGDTWDCSELVEWSCNRANVQPAVPDGAFNQWSSARNAGAMISVPDGIATRGALLFAGDGTGAGRDAITHVAFSLGDGTTIEARGQKWGVGCWSAANRFTFAARIPGVDYGPTPAPAAPTPPPAVPPYPGEVKAGSTGDAVRQVQQRLIDRGWHKVSLTGTFDDATDKVVRQFQREKGLDVDGAVGPRTWDALWLSPITP